MMATNKPPRTRELFNSMTLFLFLGEMLPWSHIHDKEGEERGEREREREEKER
jgi:hypothetical protein